MNEEQKLALVDLDGTLVDYDKKLFENALEQTIESFNMAKDTDGMKVPTRIQYNGKCIVLNSKKTLWAMPRHAKSVLRNHVASVVNSYIYQLNMGKSYRDDDYIKYSVSKKIVDKTLENLYNNGLQLVHAETGEPAK
tara:strand:- start:1731 stop:2141 length:411 start_codon:yes stop_codon:yes gene_type:complete